MAIPNKVVRGQTVVIRNSLEVADAFNRKPLFSDVVPVKIPETSSISTIEVYLTADSSEKDLGTVENLIVVKSKDLFRVSINGILVITKFFEFVGTGSFKVSRHLVDTRVNCIFS